MDRRKRFRVGGAAARSLLVAVIIALASVATAVAQGTPVPATPVPAYACDDGTPAEWTAQMDAYANAGTYPTVQTQTGDAIDSVLVEVPAIKFTGDGQSATLPVGPCQTIYRFAYSDVQAPEGASLPFAYAEIDWNTEGEPRGPNGSFSSPHFDFHFYMEPKTDIDHHLGCVSTNGRTCDQFETSYEQMRLFQEMPDPQYVPASYRADVGSAIPEMGLHLLDATFDYTVENVNHTPTLIYGTFNGEVIFAESSVTLYTLQDVIAAPGQTLSFTYQQPEAFATEIDWPTEFVITYLPETGGFKAGFASFEHHEATPPA
jgi:hypothetical protein